VHSVNITSEGFVPSVVKVCALVKNSINIETSAPNELCTYYFTKS